jgi:nucleoside-diphosphate-sugar epimerase
MSKVVVTGGSGFIGGYLVPRLRADGHQVYSLNSEFGDVAEQSTWRAIPACDTVVHLAGRSFVPDSWIRTSEYMKINYLGVIQALEYCREHKAKLVFLSSYLYGETDLQPIPESAELAATNPYAFSKLISEMACRFYANTFGIDIIILRPFNVYGNGQSSNFLVPSIIEQSRSSSTIIVRDLEPKRDYVYVKDLIEAISMIIDLRLNFHIFNIGSGLSHSVEEVISAIQHILGTSLPVKSENFRRSGEIMNTVADISDARITLGWAPRYSLPQGLADMLGGL